MRVPFTHGLPIITAGFDSIRAGNLILQLYHATRGSGRTPAVPGKCVDCGLQQFWPLDPVLCLYGSSGLLLRIARCARAAALQRRNVVRDVVRPAPAASPDSVGG